jgi:indole-3-glycerol phosphate synthase
MTDVLQELLQNAEKLVKSGYYKDGAFPASRNRPPSLVQALRAHTNFPIIAEVKLSSPLRRGLSGHAAAELIRHYVEGGAAGLSVLTEPYFFEGSLDNLRIASATGLPVLMKDIVVREKQMDAGARRGAGAVLLIEKAFDYQVAKLSLDSMIEKAHSRGLEVLLEVADEAEMLRALERKADVLGINQRDLATMQVDARKGVHMLQRFRPVTNVPLIVMSGIVARSQVEELRDQGADGVLIGSSLSSAPDPMEALRALEVPRWSR